MQDEHEQTTVGGEEFIAFRVGDQEFCVEITSTREIRGWSQATRLPHSPEYIVGVINLRGHIVSVVDLRQVPGLAQDESSAANRLLVIDYDDSMLALKVDRVLELINIADEEIEATPRMNQTPIPLEGVVTRPQGPLFLLSPADLVRRLEDNTHV